MGSQLNRMRRRRWKVSLAIRRKWFETADDAAIVIQSAYRMYKIYKDSRKIRPAAITIQSFFRGIKGRNKAQERVTDLLTQASRKVQAVFRGHKARAEAEKNRS